MNAARPSKATEPHPTRFFTKVQSIRFTILASVRLKPGVSARFALLNAPIAAVRSRYDSPAHVPPDDGLHRLRRDTPLRGYADSGAAAAFKDKLSAYSARRPPAPAESFDTPENDAEFEAWWKKLGRWREPHPTGKDCSDHNHFEVIELPYAP